MFFHDHSVMRGERKENHIILLIRNVARSALNVFCDTAAEYGQFTEHSKYYKKVKTDIINKFG